MSMMLQAMSSEGNESYEPRMEALLKEHGDAEGLPTAPTQVAQPKKRAKRKSAASKSSAKKMSRAAASGKDDAEEPEEEDAEDDEEEEDTTEQRVVKAERVSDPAQTKLMETLSRLNGAA